MSTNSDSEGSQDELEQAKRDMKQMAAEESVVARDRTRERRRDRGERRSREPRGRDNVISCRLDDTALNAVDTLVEAGVRATRADAAAWLIQVGLEANRELLDDLTDTVAQIRHLRENAVNKAQRHAGHAGHAEQPSPASDDSPTA